MITQFNCFFFFFAGGIVAGKAIMSMCGIDVGPPRLPLLPLSIDDHRSLEKELQSLGFFDWN